MNNGTSLVGLCREGMITSCGIIDGLVGYYPSKCVNVQNIIAVNSCLCYHLINCLLFYIMPPARLFLLVCFFLFHLVIYSICYKMD